MGFSRSPKLVKGAFVQIDIDSSVQRTIEFQYNPEKIDRRIKVNDEPKSKWSQSNRNKPETSETTPHEFLVINLILDASDALENPEENANTAENGIYSKLSAIELLVYSQKYSLVKKRFMGISMPGSTKNQTFTLFVWGNKRIIPVHIKELHIVEEVFDSSLNPVRANIEISMRVLNDNDLLHNKKGLEYWYKYIAGKISLADKAYIETNPEGSKNT